MADYSNMQKGKVESNDDPRLMDLVFSEPFTRLWNLSLFFLLYNERYIEERGLHHIEKQILDDLLEQYFFPRFDYIEHPLTKKFMDYRHEIKPVIDQAMVEKVIDDITELELHPLGAKFEEELDKFIEELEGQCSYKEGTEDLKKSSKVDYSELMKGKVEVAEDPRPVDIVFSEPLKKLYYTALFFLRYNESYKEEWGLDHFEKDIIDGLIDTVFFPKFAYIPHVFMQKIREKPRAITKELVDRIFKDVVEMELHPLGEDFKSEFDNFVKELNENNPYQEDIAS